ncbi:MAG: chemotaxis protein CheW [Spirochaetales bacterium]|nr:chemotaxis protein CheW [Spirochaetales bacterium]
MSDKTSENIELVKFVIFNIDQKVYALPGNMVREIIIGYKVYYLPFIPGYIRGLINRHGEPYTVVDIKVLFEQERLEAEKYIIIRDETDKLALIITEISKIVNIDQKEIHPITSHSEGGDFFNNSISIEGVEIPILEIESVIRKIKHDIK